MTISPDQESEQSTSATATNPGQPISPLRQRAEALLARRGAPGTTSADDIDIRSILHEFSVFAIEMEMQLEEMRRARDEGEKALRASRKGRDKAALEAQIAELLLCRRDLEAGLRRYVELYDFAPTAYLTVDPQGVIHQCNLAAARLLGISREALVGQTIYPVLDCGAACPCPCTFPNFLSQVFQTDDIQRCELNLRRRGEFPSRFVCIEAQVYPSREICRMSLLDITERKRGEEQLLIAGRVFDHAGEGILITGSDNRILTVNKAFTLLTGYTAEEIIGKTPRILSSGRQDKTFYREMWRQLLERGWWQGEIWNRRKDGALYLEWLTLNCIRDPMGEIINYMGIFTDITSIKDSQRRMEFLATHDPLTGLPNRSMFLEHMEQLFARAGRGELRFAVLFVDLDNFKVINDSLGHAAGDALLKAVSRNLQEALRGEDLIARFGGDEFAILLLDTLPGDVDAAVLRITQALAEPVAHDDKVLHTSASIGISHYPEDGRSANDLLRNADSAMYLAKERGKRQHCYFSNELRTAAEERFALEVDLRAAIANKEITVWYQPQVELRTGKVVSVEALARWFHREHGAIPRLMPSSPWRRRPA